MGRRGRKAVVVTKDEADAGDAWTRLRFAVVGPLLASPPPKGGLRAELQRLSRRDWEHPVRGGTIRFSVSTIERWYYKARSADRDPVRALRRRVRCDAGRARSVSPLLMAALRDQYRAHPTWSVQLHHDNLCALVEADPSLGPMPSYATLTRVMRSAGLERRRRQRKFGGEAERPAVEGREVLSYEVSRSHALWHADFHHARTCRVLTPSGEWRTPILLSFIDDHSRLVCHMQWYLGETTEIFVHGISQAFMKRGLPRSLLTDNGSAMTAGEVQEGLHALGVLHHHTLVRSPYQNGKQEVLFAQVEGRLMAMLENVETLTLQDLNDATVIWFEREYHRRVHRETGVTPLRRVIDSEDASRTCPDSSELRAAFRIKVRRKVRRSDATVTVASVRYQLPAPWRHLREIDLRVARWDLSGIDMVDGRTGDRISTLRPVDKSRNAEGLRRRTGRRREDDEVKPQTGPAPLLKRLRDEQDATGLPPAWLPFGKEAGPNDEGKDNNDQGDMS